MPPTDDEPNLLRDLAGRGVSYGSVAWLNDNQLVVADADTARQVHADNFADLTLPDRFIDHLRHRRSTPVSWKQVRSLWLHQLHALSGPAGAAALAARMETLLRARAGSRVNLVWLAHEVIFRSLTPIIIDGLPDRDLAWIARDAVAKLDRLIGSGEQTPRTRRQRWEALRAQVRTGVVVRKEIRGRARGRRPPRADLTQPIVTDLLPTLGADRALDAVTAVLTAVAGPPGAVASCLMFELQHRPDWAALLTRELSALEPGELCRSGVRCAPITSRFVREVMRVWSAPLLLTRSVRTPITLPTASLTVGQQYLLSPFMVHHDPTHWPDPDVFDPDRWLPGATHRPAGAQHSVPFGWQPTSCIGAGIGLLQLVLLCELLCTKFHIAVEDPAAVRMVLAAVPIPLNFHGVVTAR